MNKFKNACKAGMHFGELVLGLAVPVVGLPFAYHGLIKTIDTAANIDRNNSVFNITTSKGYNQLFNEGKPTITQSLPTYKQIAQIRGVQDNKDRSLFLKEQLTNCLLRLSTKR